MAPKLFAALALAVVPAVGVMVLLTPHVHEALVQVVASFTFVANAIVWAENLDVYGECDL